MAIRDIFRTGYAMFMGTIITGIAGGSVMFLAWRDKDSPAIESVIRWWARSWLKVTGTTLTVSGEENVDPSRTYVIVSNHLSTIDIFANFLAVPVPIRFLAKRELFSVPVLGGAMRAIGIIEVDRDRHGASVQNKLNDDTEEALNHRHSIMVYAEGTRSRTGVMRPFKKGAFAIAVKNQLPILPVTIHGGWEAWPPGGLVRGGPITVTISKPIDVTGTDRSDIPRLLDETRQVIHESYEAVARQT